MTDAYQPGAGLSNISDVTSVAPPQPPADQTQARAPVRPPMAPPQRLAYIGPQVGDYLDPASWNKPDFHANRGYPGVDPSPYMPQSSQIPGLVPRMGGFFSRFGSKPVAANATAMNYYWAAFLKARMTAQHQMADDYMRRYAFQRDQMLDRTQDEINEVGEIFALNYAPDAKWSSKDPNKLQAALIDYANRTNNPRLAEAASTSLAQVTALLAAKKAELSNGQRISAQQTKQQEQERQDAPWGGATEQQPQGPTLVPGVPGLDPSLGEAPSTALPDISGAQPPAATSAGVGAPDTAAVPGASPASAPANATAGPGATAPPSVTQAQPSAPLPDTLSGAISGPDDAAAVQAAEAADRSYRFGYRAAVNGRRLFQGAELSGGQTVPPDQQSAAGAYQTDLQARGLHLAATCHGIDGPNGCVSGLTRIDPLSGQNLRGVIANAVDTTSTGWTSKTGAYKQLIRSLARRATDGKWSEQQYKTVAEFMNVNGQTNIKIQSANRMAEAGAQIVYWAKQIGVNSAIPKNIVDQWLANHWVNDSKWQSFLRAYSDYVVQALGVQRGTRGAEADINRDLRNAQPYGIQGVLGAMQVDNNNAIATVRGLQSQWIENTNNLQGYLPPGLQLQNALILNALATRLDPTTATFSGTDRLPKELAGQPAQPLPIGPTALGGDQYKTTLLPNPGTDLPSGVKFRMEP